MRICLEKAAHISAERRISVQMDMQTDIDMETNMDMGVKYVYIGAFGPRVKSINKAVEASKVTSDCCVNLPELSFS
jgi:hypothetical protein